MIFAPKSLGQRKLTGQELAVDKKNAKKIGPCGIGEKALYLNSFYFSRRFYVTFPEVRRVFKRVAMSKGGFTGKGAFGSMAYLVVQMANGEEKQCNFKFEEQVDQFLEEIARQHPHIPTHSKEAEQKLARARAEEEKKYLKKLDTEAQRAVDELTRAQKYLEKKPELSRQLTYAAREKRSVDNIPGKYKVCAGLMLGVSLAAMAGGLILFVMHKSYGMYGILFGGAFTMMVLATNVLPTSGRNKKTVQRDWDQAVGEMGAYLGSYEAFPIRACYAHPATAARLIRVLRMGKAHSISEAMLVMKDELKAINAQVTVSQMEYDEIVAIKPMFALMDYE